MYKKFDIRNRKTRMIPYPRFAPQISERLHEVEEAIENYLQAPHVVVVNQVSSAVFLAIKALELLENTEIIIPAAEMADIAISCEFAGLHLGFADCCAETQTMAPTSLKERISSKTSAVLVSSLYGHPTHWEELKQFTNAHHLKVIELARDSLGGIYRGKKAGTLGDIGIIGFHYLPGAAIVCHDPRLREQLLTLRDMGINSTTQDFGTPSLDFNPTFGQLNDIFTLIKDLDEYLEIRSSIVKEYEDRMVHFPHLIFPAEIVTATHVYNQLLVTIENRTLRDRIIQYLISEGFEPRPALRFFPTVKRYQKRWHHHPDLFKNAQKLCDTGVIFPLDIPRGSAIPENIEKIIKTL